MFRNTLMSLLAGFFSPCALLCVGFSAVAAESNPAGMVWIPGGTFTMGSDLPGSKRNEQPTHKVSVDGFWIDEHAVTNAEFESSLTPPATRPPPSGRWIGKN